MRGLGRVPVPDLERTPNMGVGMVAVTSAQDAARAVEFVAARGVPAWVLGEVRPVQPAVGDDVTQGSKGVDGGAVRMVGSHPAG